MKFVLLFHYSKHYSAISYGWLVSHLPLYQKIVPNISSNHRLQVWGKLFQAFVLTETKIMIFLNHGHIWFLVPINGIGVCLARAPKMIPTMITLIGCPCESQSKKAKIVLTETVLIFFFEKLISSFQGFFSNLTWLVG